MLAKKYRFHSRGGVRYTYQHGKTIRDSKISLVFATNGRNRQRYAIVVSKKILKSAVGRNRIRRRVYEAVRAELPNIQKPVDCIFIINTKEIAQIDFKDLRGLIHDLLIEAKII